MIDLLREVATATPDSGAEARAGARAEDADEPAEGVQQEKRERRPDENVAATKAIEAVEVSWLIDSEEDFSADEQTEMLI